MVGDFGDWLEERTRRERAERAVWWRLYSPDRILQGLARLEADEPGPSAGPILGRLRELEKEIRETTRELEGRAELFRRISGELDYHIEGLSDSLARMQGGVGYNRGVDEKRLAAERELWNLRNERRSQAVGTMRELIPLRERLRGARRSHRTLRRLLDSGGEGEGDGHGDESDGAGRGGDDAG